MDASSPNRRSTNASTPNRSALSAISTQGVGDPIAGMTDMIATKPVAAIHCFRSSTRKRNSMKKKTMLDERASGTALTEAAAATRHNPDTSCAVAEWCMFRKRLATSHAKYHALILAAPRRSTLPARGNVWARKGFRIWKR